MTPRQHPRGLAEIERHASHWIIRRDVGLTATEAAELARWRAADPRHEEILARKERAWTTLGRPLDAGQADALLERLAERAARRRRRKLGIAAVAALVLVAIGMTSFRHRSSSSASVAQGTVLLPEKRTLPDGTKVELRAGADLAVEFAPARRLIRLTSGTAHFEVAENKSWPFVVQAGGIEFRAVGTAFSVEVESSRVELLVTEGRVAVDKSTARDSAPADTAVPDAAPSSQTLAEVAAGNRIVIAREPAAAPTPTAVSPGEMSERLAWRVPRLEFSELPLAEAVQLMNRYNRVQFTIPDSHVSRLRISGVFRADNLDAFVRLLEGTCGVAAERTGDIIVLKPAAR